MPGESIPQGLWLPPRVATLLVAASNSLDRSRAQADYICDGVADDVEIQAALNALTTSPSAIGRVVLSEGAYILAADITVPDYCALEGQGSSTRLYFGGDAIVNAITLDGDYCIVKNLSAELQDGAGGIGTRPNIIYSTGFDRMWLENLEITGDDTVADDVSDLRQCGILIINGHSPKITSCVIQHCVRHGIHLNSVESGIIKGNTSSYHGRWGILINNVSHWNILGNNQCYMNEYGGIDIDGSVDCDLTGNTCNNNELYGILLDTAQSITVTGCTCMDNWQEGISLETATDCVISSNVLIDNDNIDTGLWHAINVDANSINNQITGNVCNLNHGRGMNIIGANNNITGNQCSTNDREGIYASGPNCQINNNHIYDNGQDAAGTYHGIDLGGTADNCQVNDNYCDSPEDSQEDGIHLGAGAHYIQIIGNYCLNGMGNGIELGGNNDYCLIKDNYCYNNDDYGINISAATCLETTVENNKLEGNTTGAINDLGTDTELPEIVIDAPNPDGNIGEFPAQLMLDDVDTEIRMKLHCPTNFQELVRAHVILVPGTGGNLRRQIDTDFGKVCSESYTAHTDAVAVDTVAVTANKLECIDIAEALTGIAASDWIGVRFTRNGTDALDTIGDTVYLIGIRMQYV